MSTYAFVRFSSFFFFSGALFHVHQRGIQPNRLLQLSVLGGPRGACQERVGFFVRHSGLWRGASRPVVGSSAPGIITQILMCALIHNQCVRHELELRIHYQRRCLSPPSLPCGSTWVTSISMPFFPSTGDDASWRLPLSEMTTSMVLDPCPP